MTQPSRWLTERWKIEIRAEWDDPGNENYCSLSLDLAADEDAEAALHTALEAAKTLGMFPANTGAMTVTIR